MLKYAKEVYLLRDCFDVVSDTILKAIESNELKLVIHPLSLF